MKKLLPILLASQIACTTVKVIYVDQKQHSIQDALQHTPYSSMHVSGQYMVGEKVKYSIIEVKQGRRTVATFRSPNGFEEGEVLQKRNYSVMERHYPYKETDSSVSEFFVNGNSIGYGLHVKGSAIGTIKMTNVPTNKFSPGAKARTYRDRFGEHGTNFQETSVDVEKNGKTNSRTIYRQGRPWKQISVHYNGPKSAIRVQKTFNYEQEYAGFNKVDTDTWISTETHISRITFPIIVRGMNCEGTICRNLEDLIQKECCVKGEVVVGKDALFVN